MATSMIENEVLKILADNINNNESPGALSSDVIAHNLDMTLPELVDVLKLMNEKGAISSNVEFRYSIITEKGLSALGHHSW